MRKVSTLAALAVAALAVAAPAAAKPKPCKPTQHRVHGKCVAKAKPMPKPSVDFKAWAPKVEVFYKETIPTIDALSTTLGSLGTVQPGDLLSAVNNVASCDKNLARDTGASPADARAHAAMKQLHQVCSLLSTLAGEIALTGVNLDATQVAAATTALHSAESQLKTIVASLSQPV